MNVERIEQNFLIRPLNRSPSLLVSRTYDGAWNWNRIEFCGLGFGDLSLWGRAEKKDGVWQVKLPFNVVGSGQEKPFSPNFEKLCELAVSDLSAFEQELRFLLGTDGSLDEQDVIIGTDTVLSQGEIEVRVQDFLEVEGRTATRYKRVVLNDFPVGDWKVNAWFIQKEGEAIWDLEYSKLVRELKLPRGFVEEECFLEFDDVKLMEKELTLLFNAVRDEDFEKAKQVLKDLSNLDLPQGLKGRLSYASEDGNFYVSASDVDGLWTLRVGRLDEKGFSNDVCGEVKKLIKQVKETGNDEDLRSFCEELLRWGRVRRQDGLRR